MSTRDKIKDTARRLFGLRGFDGVSVREIAGEAGVNVSAVSYHFGGKEQLFREVVQDSLASFRATVEEIGDEELPLRQKAELLIEAFLEFLQREDSVSRIIMTELALGGARLPDIAGEHFLLSHELFRKMIEQGVASGEIRPVDHTLTLLNFISLPVYLTFAKPIIEHIRGTKGYSRAFIKKVAHHTATVLFDGLRNRAPGDEPAHIPGTGSPDGPQDP